MDDAVGSDGFGVVDCAALDLEHDVCGEAPNASPLCSAVAAMVSVDDFADRPARPMRQGFPYAPIQGAAALLDKLAATEPQTLACMHGASYRGDGAALLQRLGAALSA